MLLSDRDLLAEINAGRIKITPQLDLSAGHTHRKSPIQPSSLDLHIGQIYFPNVDTDVLGGINNPFTSCLLNPGNTAVLVTREEIELPNDIAAIGFPPSSVSFQGLLVTNPGHVDPSYRGSMRFAVINMGSDKFKLSQDDKIITLLFFKLEADVDAGFCIRNYPGGYTPHAPVKEEDLKCLAADFVEVEKRARAIAKEENKWPMIIGSVSGAVAILLAGMLAFGKDLIINSDNWKKPLLDLDSRMLVFEKSASIETMKKQLTELKSEVDQLKSVQEKKRTR